MEQLFSLQEVADLLQLHPDTIRGWIRAGRFPRPIELTAKVKRWRSSDIEAFIAGKESGKENTEGKEANYAELRKREVGTHRSCGSCR